MANRTKLTVKARATFLEVLREAANVSEAARAIGMARRYLYEVRDGDRAFAAEWAEALDEATDRLEREAWRRAVDGVEKPVYQRGECVGYVQEYSDTLMSLLLKAHKPEKYKDRVASELTGKDGGPIQTEATVTLTAEEAYKRMLDGAS